MPEANPLRFVAILFVAFCWLLNLTIVRLGDLYELPVTDAVLAGLGFAQIGMLAAWVALGRGQLGSKALTVVVAAAVLVQPLAGRSPYDVGTWSGTFFFFGLFVIGVCVASRTLKRMAEANELPVQFTIAGILSLTTALAIAVGVSRQVTFPGATNLVFGLVLALSFLGCLAMRCSWPGWQKAIYFAAAQTLALFGCRLVGLPIGVCATVFAALCGLTLTGIGIERVVRGARRSTTSQLVTAASAADPVEHVSC